MQTTPDPKLLSLLEKLNNPIKRLNLKFQVQIIKGVYSIPDEWKQTDDANPGMFTYQVRFYQNIDGAKIIPRELTEREKREHEELAAAKNKKAAKKDTKDQGQQENEELQRILKQEEEELQKRQDYLQTLSPQEQFYFNSEDKYKAAFIRFDNNERSIEFNDEEVQNFEDQVYNKGGVKIEIVKLPAISEDEITKLKKGKPKNLNLAELQPIIFRGWCPLEDFREPGCNVTLQRIQITQTEDGVDAPKYNLDKTYIKLEVTIDPPVTKLITEVEPVKSLCERYQFPIPAAPSGRDCLDQFNNDIILAMQALAAEYKGAPKDSNDKSKVKTTLTEQRKQELQKKKEAFLAEFNKTNYKLLKDRLRKSILGVCIDKFQKQGLYTGVTKDDKDRLFAELYVFLMEDMQKTLGEYINQSKDEIHEDLLICYELNIKDREKIYQSLTKETPQERFQRLANEYEILNIKDQTIKNYNNLIQLDQHNHKNLYSYARYCLRIQDFKKAEQLTERAYKIEPITDYKLLLISLYIRRERYKEAQRMTQELLAESPSVSLYYVLMSFICKLNGDQRTSDKYKRCVERIFMRTMGLLVSKSGGKQQQDPHQLPSLKQQTLELQELAKKAPVLSKDQQDHIQMELLEYFGKINLMDLVEKAMPNILDKTTSKITILKAQIQIFKNNNTEALNILNKFLEQNPRNYEVHLIKGSLCYQSEQFYEAEEIFIKALKIKQQQKTFPIYLRLGYMYLKRKSWEDAKQILEKAIEISSNSSLSWLGMGIATLRMEKMSLSEESLTQANIYEPFNGEVWGYLALLCLKQGKRNQQAIQCISMMENTEKVNDLELLEELADEMFKCQNFEESKKLFLRIFRATETRHMTLFNIGQLQYKLGKVYDLLKKYDLARDYYLKAMKNLQGETEKALVRQSLEGLSY